MTDTVLKVIRVFIGSPGGLNAERQMAKRIVDEVNQSHAEHWGCQFNLIGWEETLPGYNRAQALINQELDKCDFFVGVIWDHWGSKPDGAHSKYTSGFEEEFERAKGHVESGQMKDIALLFKAISDKQLNDPGTSAKKVIAFREKCIRKRKPLFKDFATTDEFAFHFRAKLEAIGWQHHGAVQIQSQEALDPGQPASTENKTPDQPNGNQGLIGGSSTVFVTELLTRSADWDRTSPHEIARLRLIALSASRPGNDETYLGNHDANLLFAKRDTFHFDERENTTLIDVGVVGFHHQNVPLWRWLAIAKSSGEMFYRIKVLSAVGNKQERANAIRLLQAAGETTPSISDYFDRRKVLNDWLVGDLANEEFNAALDFLKTNGDLDDLRIIEDLIEQAPPQRKSAIAATIVLMKAATSIRAAFERLVELDPASVSESDAAVLFAQPQTVTTSTIESCLTLKSESIRRRAALALQDRQAIDETTAHTLLADPDLDIRLVAVEALLRHGTPIEEELIKKALVKQRPGLTGLGFFSSSGSTDDTHLKKYYRNRLLQLSYDELRKKAEASGVYDDLEVTALAEKYTGRQLGEIRANLNDCFVSYFDSKVAKVAAQYPDNQKLIADIKSLGEYLRKNLTSKTLDVLCHHSDETDLSLVRRTLDTCEVEFSPTVLRYLQRFGDWTDVDRIQALYTRYGAGETLLSIHLEDRARPIADALYVVGKTRIGDLLKLDANSGIRRALVARFSQKDIASLSDDTLVEQLNDSSDQFRKALALKCALSLPQARIRKLLGRYINQDGQRYYNSIHWLDLGASMPRHVVKRVAGFELGKQA